MRKGDRRDLAQLRREGEERAQGESLKCERGERGRNRLRVHSLLMLPTSKWIIAKFHLFCG